MPRNATRSAAVAEPTTAGEQVLVAEFDRPRGEKIRCHKGVGRDGGTYWDVRNWYTDDNDGELKPTRKGVRLSAAEADALKAALAAVSN